MRILIIAAVAIFLVLWVKAALDVFRRGDLNSSAKAGWAIIMLILPFVGLIHVHDDAAFGCPDRSAHAA